MEWKNGLISGVVGGIVLTIISFASMFIPRRGDWYSVTFPQMVSTSGTWSMTASTIAVGLIMGLVYSAINPAISGEGIKKGINYGVMAWLLAGLMWPIMMMGFAPAYMWLTELISGLVSYLITGIAVVAVYKRL